MCVKGIEYISIIFYRINKNYFLKNNLLKIKFIFLNKLRNLTSPEPTFPQEANNDRYRRRFSSTENPRMVGLLFHLLPVEQTHIHCPCVRGLR